MSQRPLSDEATASSHSTGWHPSWRGSDFSFPRQAPKPPSQHETQISHVSKLSRDQVTESITTLQDGGQLSFFERHFTRPINKDSADVENTNSRRFLFLSRGFLIAAATMLIVLVIIAVAVAVGVDHSHHHRQEQQIGGGNGGTGGTANPGGGGSPGAIGSPIRAAIQENFPDPSIWFDNGTWYAYATNNAAGINDQTKYAFTHNEYGQANVQLATSKDFVHWRLQPVARDPLPMTGAWVVPGFTNSTKVKPAILRGKVWAPSIIRRPSDNKYVLYYSASSNGPTVRAHNLRSHCIGAAVSETDSPAGPFRAQNETLICTYRRGGSIDTYAFLDLDGTLYVAYKVDGNSIGHGGVCGNTHKPIVPTPIMLQKLHPDGIAQEGYPEQILDRIESDGPLIEAPALIRSQEGIYFLFFSSGCTRSRSYTVKYATAKDILGPYIRAPKPLLKTGDWGLLSPGSVGIHKDSSGGGWNMAFHARIATADGKVRAMFTTKLDLVGTVARMVRHDSPVNHSSGRNRS